MVVVLPHVELGACSSNLHQLAARILAEEVDRLQDAEACCTSSQTTSLDAQDTAPAPGGVFGGVEVDSGERALACQQPALVGRLQLVAGLVRALDKSSEGSPEEQQLIKLLLHT